MKLSLSILSPVALATLAALAATTNACVVSASPSESIAAVASADSAITAVSSFGSNPGNLLMYSYAPQGIAPNAPLVLALHGCTQTAANYEDTGWNKIADVYQFYLVYPQQQSANNTESCFNWFGNTSGSTADITRGQGEAASIIQMVDYMKTTYSIDASRIYVTGFSAGAAYAVALLAMYPDVFAAGASFAGVPYGCATSLTSAYTCMDGASSNTAAQWGTLAKTGFPGYTGKYPRLSVWQGSSDTTVNTANLGEIVSQWTNVTGVSATATSTSTVAGYPHSEYADSNGVVQVESYSITGMAHGVAIDVSSGCGTADTYSVDKQICATARVAEFFGLQGQGDGGLALGGSSSGGVGSGSGSGGIVGGSSNGGQGASSGSAADASSGSTGTASTGTGNGAAAAPADLPGCSAAPGNHGGTKGAVALLVLGVALTVRRRARATRLVATASAVAAMVLASTNARAAETRNDDIQLDDEPPPPVNRDVVKRPKPAILGPQGTFFTGAAVSATPAVLFGYFPVDHFATTIGVGFTYNGNGSPSSPLTEVKGAPNNHVGSDLFLDFLYFVHDRAPFAMGPELNFITSMSPNVPFTVVVVTPMWALRYAPWKAPIAIGTGLGMSIAFTKGAQPVASLATQGLDIVYAF